ncbi:MAG TPA: ThuA domain-containing protein, partial [Solirubrobacter sp.]|nr:ThuA domain-containing protein [Solirubrobacter sp.]
MIALAGATAIAPAAQAQDEPGAGKRVLLYTGTTGYRHTDGINGGRPVIQSKLEALGYGVDWEDCNGRGTGTGNCNHANKNPRIFTGENLARYDAVVFLNMSWSWNAANPGPLLDLDSQKDAIISYVQNGGGIAVIHNASDAGAGKSVWDWWDGSPNSVVGTTMPGHAATNANGNFATVQVADNNHLATRDLPDTWTLADEHYNFLSNVRGGHHVLATFDERTYNPGVNARGQDHPITYCKLYDGENVNDGTSVRRAYRDGRTWVTGMGHFGVRYSENGGDNNMVKMMVGGIRWVAGEGRKSDCSGTVWSSFTREVLVSDALNPIGIDVAKDGKVYWSEIGPSIGTAVNGHIKMHDPAGAPNNKTTVATIETRSDHSLSEDGVLGMSLQPGFDLADASKRNLFVYYSPRNPEWPTSGAAQVVGYNQISRFTLNADGTAVVPGSERVILRVPKVKINGSPAGFPGGPTNNGPGHVGGAGLDFDSEGNMYLGIGDDVSPNAPGHNGLQPMDYRAAERWDARKTSANTAD